MNSPLKFPNNADVIAQEAARWRALTPEEWMRSFRGILRAGAFLLRQALDKEHLRQYRLEQRELARRAIRELIARHARVATSESLIVTKLASFRLQDQADIESLLSANRDTINMALIRSEWAAVADSNDERTVWLENAIARIVPWKE